MMFAIRTATGLIAWYMRACGFAGWASFWRVIYVLPGYEHHERKHLEQIEHYVRLDCLASNKRRF